MKAKLTPKTSYSVSIDGVELGTFQQRGESLNGMIELRNLSGEQVIVEDLGDLDKIFGGAVPMRNEVNVIGVAPIIKARIEHELANRTVKAGDGSVSAAERAALPADWPEPYIPLG